MAVVPVRANPSDRSELVTQILFGEHYSVDSISEDKKWAHVMLEFDHYEGWIDLNQHTAITDEYFNHLSNTEFKISTDIISTILYKKQLIQIIIGSVLPISSSELFEVNEQFAFNGASKNIGDRLGIEFMRQVLNKFMNAPYLWGGKTPFGIDCSGLTQQVFKLCGYRLKRDAHQQYLQGQNVANIRDAMPGDLAFFRKKNGPVSHVGIIMENQQIIHASGHVRQDKLDEKGIFNEELSNYTHNLDGIKRVFKT